jgi:hypothetical protein
MKQTFNYLIGEGFPRVLESESSQEEDGDEKTRGRERIEDVLRPSIIKLEWLMF